MAAIPRPLILAAFLPAVLAGCNGEPPPPTYPVTGKVVYKQSREPLAGGTIRFQPVADPGLTITGTVQKDGTFTLNTHVGKRQVAGAVEGEHRVVLVPGPDDNKKYPAIQVLTTRCQVKAEANDVVIEIVKTP